MERSIELKKINKSYANKRLFTDLSYAFQQRVYHLCGGNGVGKSTLLRLIVGLETPDSGTIVLNNQYSVRDNSVNGKRLFYAPDDLAIYPFLKGHEFLFWLAKLRTKNTAEINQLLERFELEEHAQTKIAEMSFGTKKKFLLSSALMGEPDFIILDEPFNGLDKKSQQVLLELLEEKASQCGILLTTHHDAYLERLNPIKIEVLAGQLASLFREINNLS